MVPKSDHLANPRFDKKPSAQGAPRCRPSGKLAERWSDLNDKRTRKLVGANSKTKSKIINVMKLSQA